MSFEREKVSGIRKCRTYIWNREVSGWTKLKEEIWIKGEKKTKLNIKKKDEKWHLMKVNY